MKNNVRFYANNCVTKILFAVILTLMLMGAKMIYAEVHFAQTTNADFNKGVLNNVIVTSDNVSLQFDASGVGTWLTTTVLPQTLSGHKTVSWNDRYVFLVGGYNGLTYSGSVYKATVQSTGITSWTAQNALPVALKDPAVVVGTNTIYVMGGRNDSQVFNTIYYASIAADGTLGAWQTSTVTLPVTLWGHSAVYVNGYIYVAGGASTLTSTDALNTVYYTQVLATNTLSAFTAGTVLPATRNKHSMTTYNGKMYVLGGYANGGTRAATVYSATPGADGSTGAWSTETALPLALSNHSSVVTNGLIMVLAGENNTTLSNIVYYADADAGALTWTASPNVMYDYVKDGSAFTGNGQVYGAGGTNLSGMPIHNCRYASLALTTNYINHGLFISNPYFELGAERVIDSLIFSATFNATFANCQISYRTAPASGIWGNWTALTATSPIIVGQTKQYLQYKVVLTGQTTYNATFHDMTLTTPGTQLAGNLNAITTFTQALSPYWATSDITFTAGTHTFQAGTVILFLPQTGLTVGQANVICNGTVADSVKFLYYTGEAGLWDGIYFDPNSDNGVSSQLYYTAIANAGYGSNNANLFCDQSNEPLLSHCSLRGADGNGLRLSGAHVDLYDCSLRGNTENGAYLASSNPTFGNCALSYNGGAGVYLTSSASNPTYSTTTIDHNLYGFHYPSPNDTFFEPDGSPTLTANTYNGIAIDGGDVSGSNRVWNSISYDYILLGNVTIVAGYSYIRLTIEPGNTIKVTEGKQIQVGRSCCEGGELYALGTVDSLITFTAWNGLAGGWNGIYFTDQSDAWGGQSQLDYCVIEKGNEYNFLSVSTNQPNVINRSIIRNAVQDGARIQSYAGSILNCQFQNNGRYPLYYLNPDANPIHSGNTYTGNAINRIVLPGGDYTNNRPFTYDGIPYYVLNDMYVVKGYSTVRITVYPGVTMEFAPGKILQIGRSCCEGGEIYAVGKADSLITFKAYNDIAGGWTGIYFPDQNDAWGGVSTMKHCVIKQGATYNIKCENSTQPSLDSCIISNSALDGIVETSSSPQIHNCQFLNNNGYPIKYLSWQCNSHLSGNTYTGNNPNYIALSGGDYTSARTLYYDGIPYHVLNDIFVVVGYGTTRLTVRAGVTLEFDPGKKLQLGRSCCEGGEIYAKGTADSLITFKAFADTSGGWAGIYFPDQNDTWGGVSTLEYCLVKQGNSYNVLCENSAQPTITNSTFANSLGDGLKLVNSSLNIRSSTFRNNQRYGMYLEGSSSPTIGNTAAYTCNLYNNGSYELYQNGTANVNARYNFWGTGDSTMIAVSIFDYYDNTAKGKVYFGPFAQVPYLQTTTTAMNGTVKYDNTLASPVSSTMVIKDFGGLPEATTTSNTSGVYAFTSFESGNYQLFITPTAPWGGVNSTDALDILNHFAHITQLTGMNMAAADVNLSRTINASDALFVMKRYTGLIPSFPAGDFLYHCDTVFVTGNQVTNNIKMLCFGDVNASYVPPAKIGSGVALEYNGFLPVASYNEFELPVRIKHAAEIGAISLGFYYPEEFLEILAAELPDGNPDLVFNATDGLFRMAWCNLEPAVLGNDDIVVTLKMKAKNLEGLTGLIALQLFESCEFANRMAVPVEPVTLEIPQIQRPIGIEEGWGLSGLSVYPNPSTSRTNIIFSIREQSHVTISLANHVGITVKSISDAVWPAGNHQLDLVTSDLAEGMYFLTLTGYIHGKPVTKTVKVVVIN